MYFSPLPLTPQNSETDEFCRRLPSVNKIDIIAPFHQWQLCALLDEMSGACQSVFYLASSSRCTATLDKVRKSWNLFTWPWISNCYWHRQTVTHTVTNSFLSLLRMFTVKAGNNQDQYRRKEIPCPVLSCPIPSWLPTKCSSNRLDARFQIHLSFIFHLEYWQFFCFNYAHSP